MIVVNLFNTDKAVSAYIYSKLRIRNFKSVDMITEDCGILESYFVSQNQSNLQSYKLFQLEQNNVDMAITHTPLILFDSNVNRFNHYTNINYFFETEDSTLKNYLTDLNIPFTILNSNEESYNRIVEDCSNMLGKLCA